MSSEAVEETKSAPLTPEVRGEGVLRGLERFLLWLERGVGELLPEPLNPLAQTGAISVATFLIAATTGILLLFWYRVSVHEAYASLQGMAPRGVGLVRSLHRYSSDACMLFVTLHALRLFAGRRFAGARTLAWVTGALLVGGLWLVGWLGYWLVWDERAQQVALGTARLLDVLPIFADPLSRSFLADSTVNSLLFFVIFFFHMLIPLGMGIPLWLHLTRLSRPRFLPGKALLIWVIGLLVAMSLALPAASAQAARMTVPPSHFTFDGWFLLPLAVMDRLGPWQLWGLSVLLGAAIFSPPWLLSRSVPPPAKVNTLACNGCKLCYADCPYDAVSLVPRTDGRRFEIQAAVNPDRCVGCGICVGSCDPGAIELTQLPIRDSRLQVEHWVEAERKAGHPAHVAFVCASAVDGSFKIDPHTGTCERLPGYRVMAVPCSGWVQARTLERIIKQGAAGALIVGCGPTDCSYREGAQWTMARVGGAREPSPRSELVAPHQVRVVQANPSQRRWLEDEADAFRRAVPQGRSRRPGRWGGALLLAGLTGGIAAASVTPYQAPAAPTELVVSFKHPGKREENCRVRTDEELAKLPPHMRQRQVCDRGRVPVRLRVLLDGKEVLMRAYAPRGIWGDGNSVAVERIPVAAGTHEVSVSIGDEANPAAWDFHEVRAVQLGTGEREVVIFDRLDGFTWHGGHALPPEKDS
jgi:ferredoxin/coenzyme F420-reducing hydrogenase delta subunit